MNIQIIGDSFNVSARTQRLVAEKIGRRLDRLLESIDPQILSPVLRLQRDKLKNFHLSFDMNLPGKSHVFATTNHTVLKSGLIDLTQEVERQVEKLLRR